MGLLAASGEVVTEVQTERITDHYYECLTGVICVSRFELLE